MLRENSAVTEFSLGGDPNAVGQRRGKMEIYPPMKFAVEWSAALVLFVVAMPIIAVLALLTKLSSPGPAFYSQVRLGKGGKPFRMIKIRTMRTDSEAKTGAVWCAVNDSRVTSLGRVLRETHLDELPQLWHVLQGRMAIIGPRPERPELVTGLEAVLPRYRERLALRPGLTGLAQVQLPSDQTVENVRRKLAHDLFYIRELGPMLDLRIVLSTVLHLSGCCFNAVARALTHSCGERVERDVLNSIRLLADKERQIGVA